MNQIIAKVPNWFDSEVCPEGLCSEHVSHIIVLFGEVVEPLGNRASLGEVGHILYKCYYINVYVNAMLFKLNYAV